MLFYPSHSCYGLQEKLNTQEKTCQFNFLILFVFKTGFHDFVQFSQTLICGPDRSEIQGDPPTSVSKVLDIQAYLGRMQPDKQKYQYWGYQLTDCLHCMLGTPTLILGIIWVWGHILVEGVEMWLSDFQDHPPLHCEFWLTWFKNSCLSKRREEKKE